MPLELAAACTRLRQLDAGVRADPEARAGRQRIDLHARQNQLLAQLSRSRPETLVRQLFYRLGGHNIQVARRVAAFGVAVDAVSDDKPGFLKRQAGITLVRWRGITRFVDDADQSPHLFSSTRDYSYVAGPSRLEGK